jgi:hypothetical protein
MKMAKQTYYGGREKIQARNEQVFLFIKRMLDAETQDHVGGYKHESARTNQAGHRLQRKGQGES